MWEEYLYFTQTKSLSDQEFEDEYVVGRSFQSNYGNQKIYRVDYIDPNLTVQSKFPNEKFKNYAEYYKKQYGLEIKNKNQFLVVSIRKRKIYEDGKHIREEEEKIHLVPELMLPTGLTDEMRADKKAMQTVA